MSNGLLNLRINVCLAKDNAEIFIEIRAQVHKE